MRIDLLKEKINEMIAEVGQGKENRTALVAQSTSGFESDDHDKGYEMALHHVLDVIEAIELAGVNADRLEIPTIFGTLYAEASGDTTHPGIYICLDAKGEEGDYKRTITLVECTPIPGNGTKRAHTLRALVWNDDEAARHDGDYSADFCILHMEINDDTKEAFEQTVTLEAYHTVQDTVDAYCLNCDRIGWDEKGNDVCKDCPVRKLMDSLRTV